MKFRESVPFRRGAAVAENLGGGVLVLAACLAVLWVLVAFGGAAAPERPTGIAAIPTPTYAEQVVELVNVERNKVSRPPLKQVAELGASSSGHSTRMATADFFGLCDLVTHTMPWDRMTAAGYVWNAAAENISVGYSAPAAAVTAWMGNAGQRNQILSATYRETGVGYDYQPTDQNNVAMDTNGDCTAESINGGPFYHYWTQDFGARYSVWPLVIAGEAFQTPILNVSLFVYTPTTPSQVRFSNDGSAWSVWQPFMTTVSWALSPGNGAKTVYGQVYDGASTYVVSDTIWLNAPPPVSPAVTISSTGVVTLTWPHQAADLWYDAYRSTVNPYFTPGGADSNLVGPIIPAPASGATVIFVDGAVVPEGIYFYQVQAVAGDGQTIADSNRTGRFVFSLTPGS
ncbi:MAG: CAP domain-containing protein [Chloroflexi bacterium]|nr:CAP domain-containing protein [Chloroflexota bacterium]